MPLSAEEVIPGAVAILNTTLLMSNKTVQSPTDGSSFRPGPFLCVQVSDGVATWLAITTKDKDGLRLELKKEWLLEGSEIWRNESQYINDARKPFRGPVAAFVKAGEAELPHQPHNRPRVSEDGVNAVLREMRKYQPKGQEG